MSWLQKQVASIAGILRGVPAAHRDDAVDAIKARLTASNPGQRAALVAACTEALATVTPTSLSHEALAAVVSGTQPRADLHQLRVDALVKRDAAGLVAIDQALRDLGNRERACRTAITNRQALKADVAHRAALAARQQAAARQRAADRHRLMLRLA